MARSKRRRRSTRGLTVGVIAGSSGVIALAIIATLTVTGQIDLSYFGIAGGSGKNGYRNITLTDAQLECEQEAKDEFGKRLHLITLDRHSSRFEKKSNRFKMFFNVDVYPKRGKNTDIAVPHFLNCFVHGSRGSVVHFESVEDKEYSPRPQRQSTGNIFGF